MGAIHVSFYLRYGSAWMIFQRMAERHTRSTNSGETRGRQDYYRDVDQATNIFQAWKIEAAQ